MSNNVEQFGPSAGQPKPSDVWAKEMALLDTEFPNCEAIGCEIHDNAGRVLATFSTESQADALITMLGSYADAAEQWGADEETIDELSGNDEGHQAELDTAEKEAADQECRADKLDGELDDALVQIQQLEAELDELRG